ncbi:hypothetical protein C8R43DRAFT_1111741 [Mycena crocata]|nr:hypothetical protein C8R43DRAFT_1111741 [Mycena crocata]
MSRIQGSDIPLPASSPSSPLGYRHVAGLWFNDGNLVLRAGNSEFRIYGGLLGDRSPVFHDMLQFPQPKDNETVDGCPVVEMSDDNEEDLVYFLKAIFDYEFFLPFPTKTNFDVLFGVLRLSTKYQVEPLRRRALVHLSSAFPSTPPEKHLDDASWAIADEEWIRLILLGNELSIDWVLPLAFYRASTLCTTAQLLDGIDVKGSHIALSSQDRLLCIEQKLALSKATSSAIINFLWDPAVIPGCIIRHARVCNDARFSARKVAETWRETYGPLTIWMSTDWSEQLEGVCFACMAAMKTAHQEALDGFWNGLPQRFGLPGWDELKQLKENSLA